MSRSGRSVRRTAARAVALLLLTTILGACAQPKPAPSVVPPPPHTFTLDEARALERSGDLSGYERALVQLSSSADPVAARRAAALHGLLLARTGRLHDAVSVLNHAAAVNPEVTPFLRLRVAVAEAGLGDFKAAAAIASEIVALSGTTAASVAALRLPVYQSRAGDGAAADESWRAAMLVPIDEFSEADFVAMADGLAAAGRGDLASQTRMRLLTGYTGGRFTEETFQKLRPVIAAMTNSEKLALASKLAKANRYDQALELFDQIPESAAEARGVRLRALFNSRNYTRLLDATRGVTLDDPSLVLLRARAAWRDDKPEEFLAGLTDLETRFPDSREAAEAKILRAKYYVTDVIDYARAIENLQAGIAAGANGSDGENVWNLGWTYALAGRPVDALQTFDRYARSWPDGDYKSNALFWSAKLLDRASRGQERDAMVRQLVAVYPFSYYSWRVRELWPAAASAPATVPQTPFPDVAAALATVDEPRLGSVRELLEIDLPRDAAREMKALASERPDNAGVQFMLAEVYLRGGEPFRANGVLQREFRQFVRHGGTGIPQKFWEVLYPLGWWDAIRAESEKYGHDPYLVAAIIRQESGFEPTTVSNAGAVGLMQIMPEEAQRIATTAGLGTVTRNDLFDPKTNIAVGAAEYAQKLKLMNGNPILAIAAYNAGEAAVGTWAEKTPVEDMDLFVESIPFAETRLYVKTVTRNRFEYRRIYESSNVLQQQPAQ